MQRQDLTGFARRTGFHIFTLKRVFRPDDGTPSRAIPMICSPKTVRAHAETGLSVKEAREAYFASKGHNSQREALRTWISVCGTRKEILEAYYATEDGSDEERFASQVMDEIFIEDLEEVTTLEEATSMLEDTPRESGVERAIFIRMYELYRTEEGVVAQ